MENIRIIGSDKTPAVEFCSGGDLSISGRIIDVNPKHFFSPLISYCRKLKTNEVHFNAKIDYIKSASLKAMYELLNALEENENVLSVKVSWFYEDGDDRMLEIGKVYSEIFMKYNFNFIACDEKVFF